MPPSQEVFLLTSLARMMKFHQKRSAVSEPRWLPNFVLYKFIAIKIIFSRIFSIMGPKRKPPMANDAIDPADSTFEDHWDKLEITLNKWVTSSLPGLVTSIMQSHVIKIIDDYISSTEFQRSLADSINFDAAGLETQLGSSEKTLKELINSNQAKIAKLDEELTKLKNNLVLKDKAIVGLEDDNLDYHKK